MRHGPDELLRLRASGEAEAATLAGDLGALFAASRDSNSDDEHDSECITIGFESAQLTALLAAGRAAPSGGGNVRRLRRMG
jgi:DnaK suppressor protein